MDKQVANAISSLKGLPIRAVFTALWENPTRRLTAVGALLATYLTMVKTLRFQRVRSLKKKYKRYSTRESMAYMTDHDAWEIQKRILQLEFPFSALKALQFALFRV